MNRRTALKSVIAAPAALMAQPGKGGLPIELHTDLHVKLEEEAQLLKEFHDLYLPRIRKAPGFVSAKLLKFENANIGKAPEHYNYRMVQVFQTEELREKWTLHEDHKIAWHKAIESHVQVPFIAFRYKVTGQS